MGSTLLSRDVTLENRQEKNRIEKKTTTNSVRKNSVLLFAMIVIFRMQNSTFVETYRTQNIIFQLLSEQSPILFGEILFQSFSTMFKSVTPSEKSK